MSGQAKIELLLSLKNKLDGGLKAAKDKISGTVQEMKDKLKSVKKSYDEGVGSIKTRLGTLKGAHTEAFSAMKDQIPGLSAGLEMLANPYVLVTAAVLALGAAAVQATGMAMDFEKGMAQVNTTAQLAPPELDKLKDKLLDLGAKSTVDIMQIPEAFNQVISAVGDVDKSLAIFEPTLRAAKAGFTDVKVVAEAVTNVMGAVGDATPTEVFDTLFATMRLGKAEFKDIAAYLPKIIPMALSAGVSFKETAGAFALLTSKGQSVEQTTTLLQNAFKALSNKDRTDAFKALGVTIFDAGGKIRPVTDIVDDLSGKLKGLSDEQRMTKLNSLGMDTEAANAFTVLSQNAGQLRDFIKDTTNSVGELDTAFEKSINTSDRLTMLGNEFKKIMIDIGYKLLPIINWGIDKINMAMTWMKDNSSTIWTVLKAIGIVLSVGLIPVLTVGSVLFHGIYQTVRLVYSTIVGIVKLISFGFEQMGVFIDWVYQKLGGEGSLIDKLFGGVADFGSKLKNIFINLIQMSGTFFDAINLGLQGNFSESKAKFSELARLVTGEKSQDEVGQARREARQAAGLGMGSLTPGDTSGSGAGVAPGSTKSDGVAKVVGDTQAAKNMTVQINALHQGDNVISADKKTTGLTMEQFEQMYNELLLRVVRNTEAAY